MWLNKMKRNETSIRDCGNEFIQELNVTLEYNVNRVPRLM